MSMISDTDLAIMPADASCKFYFDSIQLAEEHCEGLGLCMPILHSGHVHASMTLSMKSTSPTFVTGLGHCTWGVTC